MPQMCTNAIAVTLLRMSPNAIAVTPWKSSKQTSAAPMFGASIAGRDRPRNQESVTRGEQAPFAV